MRLVVQETAMGCAVASVANLLEISYSKALNLFDKPENQIFRGFFLQGNRVSVEKTRFGLFF